MMRNVEQNPEKLLDRLRDCGSLVVALSGGVDSSTLAKIGRAHV